MMKFPRLFKKTSTGAIQFWDISVEQGCAPAGQEMRGIIITEYGQLGTDSPQKTEDEISKGKNTGKKNATTAVQQAEAEAQSKWEKQKKKGYVENITSAENDETDDLIEGGIVPMLAHKFSDHAHKIKYPAFVQPKLDGIRCIAILKDGKCTLWSRTRKPINSMPHIVKEIQDAFKGQDIVLDGELYNHSFKANFEHIVSMVRQEEPHVNCTDVQYHVYDTVNSDAFSIRYRRLFNLYSETEHVLWVNTLKIDSEDDVPHYFELFRSQGYEGAMLRNADSYYLNKRSYDLQKVKEFDDAEFAIIGIDEGRGKLAGHVGAFVCRTKDGKEFLAKMSGETEKLREYFQNHKLWKGKRLTVKYQGLTGANGVPRFPVGVIIRDYE